MISHNQLPNLTTSALDTFPWDLWATQANDLTGVWKAQPAEHKNSRFSWHAGCDFSERLNVFSLAGLQYLKQVHKLTNERLHADLNQGIGTGMEQIAISHSQGKPAAAFWSSPWRCWLHNIPTTLEMQQWMSQQTFHVWLRLLKSGGHSAVGLVLLEVATIDRGKQPLIYQATKINFLLTYGNGSFTVLRNTIKYSNIVTAIICIKWC